MSFFGVGSLGGNPFSTPVGQKIEQATDGSLASENWALNMEICDLVNETDDGPRDAIKAIRKRLTQNAGKNYTIVMYTLTVLETCVKNCGRRFHILACSKDLVQELVKLIGPKNDPPTVVQEKVLSLIQSWADAFRHQTELSGVVHVYQDLLAKGIEFPATDLDAMAPIHTPERSVSDIVDIPLGVDTTTTGPIMHSPPPTAPAGVIGAALTPDQRAKLQSELDVVQGNMAVLGEMLNEVTPGKELPGDLELLQELNETCHQMQHRLVELIEKLSNDELTAELLRINDDLNNLFLRYGRWEKNREAGSGQPQSASAMLAKALGPAPNKEKEKPMPEDDSLIDLGADGDNLTDQLAKMGVSGVSAATQLAQLGTVNARNGPLDKEDEFDMFAQSRNATYENTKTSGSTYKDNIDSSAEQVSGLSALAQARGKTSSEDREFDEMAAWLEETPDIETQAEESITSSEFERFLAERAAAADALPNVPSGSPAGATPPTSAQPSRPQRQTKDDGSGLFAM